MTCWSQGDQVHQRPAPSRRAARMVTVAIMITGEYGIGSVAENLPSGVQLRGRFGLPAGHHGRRWREKCDLLADRREFLQLPGHTSASAGQHGFSGTLTYGIDKKTAIVGGDFYCDGCAGGYAHANSTPTPTTPAPAGPRADQVHQPQLRPGGRRRGDGERSGSPANTALAQSPRICRRGSATWTVRSPRRTSRSEVAGEM